MPLILASASPRRADLLASAGYAFDVAPANVDETPLPREEPRAYALRVALDKARTAAAASRDPNQMVLAADTVVVADGQAMGKPLDRADAERMLRALSGGVHEVHTAVVLRAGTDVLSEVVTTRVSVVPLSEADIRWYLDSGEPEGKAGAYAIQGLAARFIDRIEGSWSNVVGLPVSTVHKLLLEAGKRGHQAD
jgi:septum formation protein